MRLRCYQVVLVSCAVFFFFQAEDGIRDYKVTGVQTCALPISSTAVIRPRRRAQQLATLRAPLGGVVTRMTAVLGATADQSQPLVEVADPAALDIVFNVSPAEAARIHAGDAVTLSTGEGASGEALGQGAVMGVAATVDSISRAVAVRARLVRPSPTRSPRIGEAVFGRIVTGVHPRAVTVPVEALVPGGGDAFQVFVVDSGGIAHARPVTVGARTESLAEILAGLAAGETVVTAGAHRIQGSAEIVRGARGACLTCWGGNAGSAIFWS